MMAKCQASHQVRQVPTGDEDDGATRTAMHGSIFKRAWVAFFLLYTHELATRIDAIDTTDNASHTKVRACVYSN